MGPCPISLCSALQVPSKHCCHLASEPCLHIAEIKTDAIYVRFDFIPICLHYIEHLLQQTLFFSLLKPSRLCLVSQVLHKHSIAVTERCLQDRHLIVF